MPYDCQPFWRMIVFMAKKCAKHRPGLVRIFAGIAAAVSITTCLESGPANAQAPQFRLPTHKVPSVVTTLPKFPPGKGVYVAERETVLLAESRQVEVLNQSVPPGNYWVLVKGVIVNDMNNPLAVACGLHDGDYAPRSDRFGLDYTSITVGGRQRAMLVLQAPYAQQKAIAQRLRLTCQASKNSRALARWFKLTALAVEAIFPQPSSGGRGADERRKVPLPRR